MSEDRTSVEQKRLGALQRLLNTHRASFAARGRSSPRGGRSFRSGPASAQSWDLIIASLSGRRSAAGVLFGTVQRLCRCSEKGVGDAAGAAAAGSEDRPAPQDDQKVAEAPQGRIRPTSSPTVGARLKGWEIRGWTKSAPRQWRQQTVAAGSLFAAKRFPSWE